MNILVYGAGAIGSVIGGFLAKAGHEVSFLGRPWHMEKIRSDGLFITGIWGEHLIKDLNVYTDVSQLKNKSFDLIILTVKSYDTESAAREIKNMFKPHTVVVHLQNGLGNAETLLKYIPEDKLITGIVIFGAEIVEPGKVKVTVSADKTVLGSIGNVSESKVKEIAEIFNQAGIPARATNEIEKYLWAKVLYNCALNPLASLLEVPYGVLAENPNTRKIMDQIIEEIYEVGKRMGVKFEPETAEEYKQLFYSRLIPLTAEHHASMLQDIKKGRRTEIDALCGAISRYGEELGIPTPANTLITHLIKAKESISRNRRNKSPHK